MKSIKVILKISLFLMFLVVIAVVLISRIQGVMIRTHEGRYIGYSYNTNEWLINEHLNYPVREDGPYVIHSQGMSRALYVRGDGQVDAKLIEHEVNGEVEVWVDSNKKIIFSVPIRNNHTRSELDYSTTSEVMVMSDFEGNFNAFVKLLQANDVIDEELNWRYDDGHLVLVGDMVDRGNNVVPLLWLIYKLEAEAEKSGGKIHYIIGNHERYLLDGRVKSAAKKYQGSFRVTGLSPSELWAQNTELGLWLRSKPVLLKVNDVLYVHGGISPEVLSQGITLESVDLEAAKSITLGNSIFRTDEDSVIHFSKGLLFYRGLAKSSEQVSKASDSHVSQVLKQFNVNYIGIGHTLVKNIGYDYGGKVLRIDVDHAESESEALLIKGDLMFRVNEQGAEFKLTQVENL